jgi:hypothetical protein
MPCFSLYSRFEEELALAYSITVFVFLVSGLIGFMIKWGEFDKQARRNNYFGQKKYPIAGLFFDSWHWDNNEREDRNDSGVALLRELNFILNEESILKAIKARTRCQRAQIYLIRSLSFLINLGTIAFGCYIIILTQNNQEEIIA